MESDNPLDPEDEIPEEEDVYELNPNESPEARGRPADGDSESVLRRLERDVGGGVFEQKCEARLRALAYFVDPVRLQDLVLAKIYADPALYASPDSEALDPVIDLMIEQAISMDEGGHVEEFVSEEFVTQMLGMGIESARISMACKRFNGLPFSLRKTFRLVCLEGMTVQECIAQKMGSKSIVGRAIYVCFEALLGDWPLKKIPRSEQPNV